MREVIVIKIGGSILSTEKSLFEIKRVEKLRGILKKHDDKQFVLSIGGGSITRKYIKILSENGYSETEQHLTGVAVINVNAVLVRAIMGDLAEEKVLRYEDFDSKENLSFNKPILIAAAGKPGHNSDWNAVQLALRSHSKTIISMKNVKGVYNKDPKKFDDAEFLEEVSWDEYIKIIGNPKNDKPGAHYPVGIAAARTSKKEKIRFVIIGNDLENFNDLLETGNFEGSLIH